MDEWDKRGLPCVDRLILGAGVGLAPGRPRAESGLDACFAVNHLGHFLLTNLMLDALRASRAFRVVVLGSELHRGVPGAPEEVALDLDDVNCDAYPDDWEAHPPCGQAAYMSYCRSKLCNVLFARQFARNLTSLRKWAPWKGTASVAVVDPGITARTGLTRHVPTGGSRAGVRNKEILALAYDRRRNPRVRTVRQAAGDVVLAAFAPALQPKSVYEEMVKFGPHLPSGAEEGGTPFFYLRERRAVAPSDAALDDDAAGELWEYSCDLVGLE